MARYIFTSTGNIEVEITDKQIKWFGDRMDESHTGRVLVPTRLYDKFRTITGIFDVQNHQIKCFLIDNCY